jgi:hypothetical protein
VLWCKTDRLIQVKSEQSSNPPRLPNNGAAGKRGDEVNAAANEKMLDLANLPTGNRVLDVAGPDAHGGSTRWTNGLCIGDGYFC